jgi:DNA-directed RNA polymerase, mitochondrial
MVEDGMDAAVAAAIDGSLLDDLIGDPVSVDSTPLIKRLKLDTHRPRGAVSQYPRSGKSADEIVSVPSVANDSPVDHILDTEEDKELSAKFGDLYVEQIALEREAVERCVERYTEELQALLRMGRGASLKPFQQLLLKWYHPLVRLLAAEVAPFKDAVAAGALEGIPEYVPYLLNLSEEKLAVITVHEVLGACLKMRSGAAVKPLCTTIGESVQAEVNFEEMKALRLDRLRSSETVSEATVLGSAAPLSTDSSPRRSRASYSSGVNHNMVRKDVIRSGQFTRKSISAQAAKRLSKDQAYWPSRIKILVGAALVDLLRRVATYTVKDPAGAPTEVPALQHSFAETLHKFYTKKVIRLHPVVFDQLDASLLFRETHHVRYFPMLVPPRPWTAPERGGYYKNNTPIIRFHSYVDQVKSLEARHEDLAEVYRSLNVLGSTPWRLHNKLFQVARRVWDQGGGLADIPDRRDLPMPLPPAGEGRTTSWFRQIKAIERHNSNLHSLRCDFQLKLEVAERFSPRTMYFPHNMDFRGRVYPIPPHLNHMGGDLSRALLVFAEGKTLGERGLRWLKIQIANLYGKDKIPFDDRIKFVDEKLPEIFDSAKNPLDGGRWWLDADEPWQCLSACMELTQALESPDPLKFVSTLPVHQDGTCNGLQHYAALGGDPQGAKSVNLLPSARPQDVYSDVAALVQARMAQDARNGVAIAQLLEGKVDRKIIKQTVMTSVYGVTFIGARLQINNALKDRGIVSDEQMYEASVYIAKKTFESIREMFTGAKEIMEWLAQCASVIAKKGRLVSWVTPLGLPVVQHYRQPNRTHIVRTALQSLILPDEDKADRIPVNKRQQRSAFPPNFVHSLDSSHMLLTALLCEKKDITFASVHDSFWTHASTVDLMNASLREAFVQLHRRPILRQLHENFCKTHSDLVFPEVPVATTMSNQSSSSTEQERFKIEKVKDSPYFFN